MICKYILKYCPDHMRSAFTSGNCMQINDLQIRPAIKNGRIREMNLWIINVYLNDAMVHIIPEMSKISLGL